LVALARLAAADPDRIPPGRDISGAVRSVLRDAVGGGLSRAIRVQTLPALGVEARDTTWYRLGVGAPIQRIERISGVVSYADRSEKFSYEDADGDGILTPLSGSANLALARFTVTHVSGRVEERALVIASGPDRSFRGRSDNTLHSLSHVERVGADTLMRVALAPQSGDTAVFGPSRALSRVEVEHMVDTGGARVTRHYRAIVFADSSRNFLRRYRSVRSDAAGTTETVLLGRDSLPDFAPGDTGRARVTFVSALASDTLERSETVYLVQLSDTAGKSSGNKLLRVDRERVYRFGPAAFSIYRMSPAMPVANGAQPRVGWVELHVDLRPSGWIEFVGEAETSGFIGAWTNSSGRSGPASFDSLGGRRPSAEP
jgi:hypothetical protein